MASNDSKTAALVEVNNALQLRVRSMTKSGQAVDVGVRLSRLAAEQLARKLLQFALPGEVWVRLGDDHSKSASFVAVYDAKFKPAGRIVRL